MKETPWDEVPVVTEICRYCGKPKELHQQYSWAWLCPPSFGTSTNIVSEPQFTVLPIERGQP